MSEPDFAPERQFLRALFDVAVAAAQPDRIIPANLPPPPKGRTVVVGAGKASAAMARALEQHWPGDISGLVITRYGHAVPCQHIEIVEASHPVPDQSGADATRRILALAQGLGENDLMIALISGGGSALLSQPADGIDLADKQALNQILLRAGTPIGDMNVVRKHLSAIKGGRLAAAAWPAKTVALMISDVPGDDIGTIASGPTIGDSSTLLDARNILKTLHENLPPNIEAALLEPRNETPKPNDPRLANSENHVIAAPRQSLEAAMELARKKGVHPVNLGDALEGDARQLAREMAGKALHMRERPVVLVSGGETTVRLAANSTGKGGRNVEFLMSLTQELNAAPDICAIACDTDGVDGAAEIAGAIITPTSLKRAADAGYPIETALQNNDGHGFFARLGDQVITGPTLTNVNDFRAILIGHVPPNVAATP
jgi:glycerate 2-kinase